jgi:hypothetical protein
MASNRMACRALLLLGLAFLAASPLPTVQHEQDNGSVSAQLLLATWGRLWAAGAPGWAARQPGRLCHAPLSMMLLRIAAREARAAGSSGGGKNWSTRRHLHCVCTVKTFYAPRGAPWKPLVREGQCARSYAAMHAQCQSPECGSPPPVSCDYTPAARERECHSTGTPGECPAPAAWSAAPAPGKGRHKGLRPGTAGFECCHCTLTRRGTAPS